MSSVRRLLWPSGEKESQKFPPAAEERRGQKGMEEGEEEAESASLVELVCQTFRGSGRGFRKSAFICFVAFFSPSECVSFAFVVVFVIV